MKTVTFSTLADDDAILTSTATETDDSEFDGGDLDGAVGDGTMLPARLLTVKTAALPGGFTVGAEYTVTGNDENGDPTDETFVLTDADGGETLVGVQLFSEVDGFSADPADGNVELGIAADSADADAIMTSVPTVDTGGPTVYDTTDLDGVIGLDTMLPARYVTATTSASTASYLAATTITIAGLDENGDPATDELTITEVNGDETLVGTQLFSSVISITVEDQDDTNGMITVGIAADSADANAIMTSFTPEPAGTTLYEAGDLDGVLGDERMSPCRTISVTTGASVSSYVPGSEIVLIGRDESGTLFSEVLTITNPDGGETITSEAGFSILESIEVDAQDDTGGTFKVGVKDVVLSSKDPPAEIRFASTGDLVVSTSDVVDTVPDILAGEKLAILPEKILSTTTALPFTLIWR